MLAMTLLLTTVYSEIQWGFFLGHFLLKEVHSIVVSAFIFNELIISLVGQYNYCC